MTDDEPLTPEELSELLPDATDTTVEDIEQAVEDMEIPTSDGAVVVDPPFDLPPDYPTSAADPRAGGRPHYIGQHCDDCGTPMRPVDMMRDIPPEPSEIWWDEFVCPKCRDGIHLDQPHERG